jgi:hypothetical protein
MKDLLPLYQAQAAFLPAKAVASPVDERVDVPLRSLLTIDFSAGETLRWID